MKCKSSDPKHKKGLWSPDEDKKLRDYIINHGLGCWSSVPINAGLQRNGKSCRLRWNNYLRPGLKRGKFTTDEEQMILTHHETLGNKWSLMSRRLPGRSDNEIKNHWHSCLKKKRDKLEALKPRSMSLDTLTEESISSSVESSTDRRITVRPKILFADWFAPEASHSFDHDEVSVSNLNFSTEVDMENELDDLIFDESVYSYFNVNDVSFNP